MALVVYIEITNSKLIGILMVAFLFKVPATQYCNWFRWIMGDFFYFFIYFIL